MLRVSPISPCEKFWVAGANHILRLHAVTSIVAFHLVQKYKSSLSLEVREI